MGLVQRSPCRHALYRKKKMILIRQLKVAVSEQETEGKENTYYGGIDLRDRDLEAFDRRKEKAGSFLYLYRGGSSGHPSGKEVTKEMRKGYGHFPVSTDDFSDAKERRTATL